MLDNKIIFCKERCGIKAFDFHPIKEIIDTNNNSKISNDKGHRLDGKNHNWMIFQEFISIPFSYMAFVILDKIEIEDELTKGNYFDLEPYNYLFN